MVTAGRIRVVAEDSRDEVAASLDQLNQKLLASSLRIGMVPIGQCDLLEKNARFMRADQYRRLVENVRRDGQLTSVPFAIKRGARYLILSGNHRVQAAKDAGLAEVILLYTEQELTHDQQLAIQLSHNAIVGQDDLAILRELYNEIANVAMKEYSGLDDAALGQMEPPKLTPLSEDDLKARVVSIIFLPEEVERAERVFDELLKQAMGERTWVNRFADYDRFLDALAAVKQRAGVKNTATAFGLLLDIAETAVHSIVAADRRAPTCADA